MNKRHKIYMKLNLVSLFFVAVSFISVTLAWFAYSGIVGVDTEIGVKSWYIEFQKDNSTVSNNIVISPTEIYPGMETISEKVDIKNKGDSDAQISYSIKSARILDDELLGLEPAALEDKLSHDYPFHLNISLDKDFAVSKNGNSQIEVSISWPLDSGNDQADSEWGSKTFDFLEKENEKLKVDQTYKVRQPLKIIISMKAEQYMEDNDSPDLDYGLGQVILYDIKNNKRCEQLSNNCIKTYVIDTNNKVGDISVSLLPDLFATYSSGIYGEYDNIYNEFVSDWNTSNRSLNIDDIIKIISKDITNSVLVRDGFSNDIIGNIRYGNRLNTEFDKFSNNNGYYTFLNEKFTYLTTSKCYWLKNNHNNKSYAMIKESDTTSKIYEEINNECSIVPVIIASKVNLEI